MDDDAGAHGICGQGRNVYTRERAFGGNPKTYRQHKFLNVQMCTAAWRLLTGVSGNVHCRTNRKRLRGQTCSPAAKISRPSHVADAMHGAVVLALALARAYAVQAPQRGPHRLANLQEMTVIWHAAELV